MMACPREITLSGPRRRQQRVENGRLAQSVHDGATVAQGVPPERVAARYGIGVAPGLHHPALSGPVMSTIGETPRHVPSGRSDTFAVKVLLACGVLYAVLYAVINDVIAATLYPGYSRISQAISELSATAAPSKGLVDAVVPTFTGLMIAFGIGVRAAGAGNRTLRVTGGLLIAHGATFPLWILAPMTSRGQVAAAMPANDVGHIVLSAATVLLILLEIGFGAAALGRRFRIYSALTAVTVVLFGALTGIQATGIASGQATPLMGLYERISVAAWLVWLAMLAIALLRVGSRPASTSRR